jgi:hypothetical protein
MALSLQDFNKPAPMQELRMNAFQPKSSPSPAANKATINTLATYGAALSPDGNVDSAYQSITNQLSYSTSSATLDSILNQWNQNDIEGSMSAMKDVLVDPTLDDETKTRILHGFQTGQNQSSLPYKVAISSAIAGSEGENGEQEDLRVRIAQGFNDVDGYNAWAQKSINALNSENNVNWQTSVKSMIESIVPFADAARSTIFQQIVDVEGTGEVGDAVRSLTLLGEGREELRSTLARIPIAERRPIIQNIINVIKASGGSQSSNLSVLKQVEELERMIVPGAYDNTARWADNIFSIMDDTILLTPFSKGLGALRAGLRGADGARVAEETIARAGRSVEAAPASPQLMIEYKPAPVSYGDDIERMVDSIPIEPTSSQIKELREATMTEIGNPNGFSIDNVIDRLTMTDSMTSSQIIDVRQQLGVIRDKRTADLNTNVVPTPPNIVDVQKVGISSNVQPTSIAEIYKHTNPSKARIAHNAVIADESGNAARILYGTDRDSVIGNDFLPEIGGNGRVRNKLEYDEATATPDTSILKKVKESEGAIWASKVEKKEAATRIIKDWKNTIGLTNRSAMNSIENFTPEISNTGSGVRFNQVFGPKEGGFSNAFTAVDTVKASLRKYGVEDSDITLLARQPDGNYAPVNPKMDLKNGDFLVQIKYDYSYDPKDIGYDGFDISPLWGFIKIPDIVIPKVNLNQGGVLQQVVPKAVNVDIRAYGAGVSAADKSAGLQKQLLAYGQQVADKWKKLPKTQQKLVDDYIRLANDEELTFSTAKLTARGISDDGVALLVDWKTVQDTIWSLENTDVNRTLRQRGYEYFVHRGSDTKLIVEPQPRASNIYGTRYYEADTGKVRTMTNDELDKLYTEGGSTGKLRQSETFQGEEVSFVISKNNADGGYTRRIRDDDNTLNYRDGYYHVRYTDPYFVTKFDPKTKTTKTIARAETRRDAEVESRRLSDTKDGFEYDWKHDRYSTPDSSFDDNLSVQFSSGRSSQRLRGKRLDRVGSDKTIGDSGLESPIESLTRSISSVATRTSFRNVLEADKRRWVSQFGHLTRPGSNAEATARVFDPKFANVKNAKEALDLIEKSSNTSYKLLATRIKDVLGDSNIPITDKGVGDTSLGTFRLTVNQSGLTTESISLAKNGRNEEVILHELVHAATKRQLYKGSRGLLNTEYKKAYNELNDLRKKLIPLFDSHLRDKDFGENLQQMYGIRSQLVNDVPDELVTFGLTNPGFQDFLKTIKVASTKKSFLSTFTETIKKILGVGDNDTALDKIISLSDQVMSMPRTKFRVIDNEAWNAGGGYKFPNDIDEIRAGKGSNEARHAHRYITGLQDGYANLIDDMSKGFFNKVSDAAGNKGWGWVDKLARKAATKSPSSAARLTAFRLFLASNPLGQFPLQAFPVLPIISSTNPLGWGRVIQQAGILGAFHRGVDLSTTMKVGKFTGTSVEDMKALISDYELSGMSAAVNAHSYLSDDLGRLADRNIVQKGLTILGKPLRVTQSIGFDFGEQTLMSLVWLSNRDRMLRRLKKTTLNATEREELTVQTRAMTGDMNKGGEMPYNSNTFSVIMQFLQSPHKIASGLILGHKGMTGADRAKLAVGYTLTFGVPGIAVVDHFVDKLLPPDAIEAKDIIKGGLTNLLFNKFLSSITATDVNIDFSSRLQPFSTNPLTEFVGGLFTTSIPEMISGSAAPSLLSEGGRVGEFVKAVLAPFTPGEYEGVDEYKQIGLTFMQMFTGLSNTMKAQYMLELGKITTRTGQVVDDDLSFMEALAKAAGFATIDETRYWEANKKQWEISDGIDNDIKTLVDGLFVKYTREGGDITDTQSYIDVMKEASRVFQNNPIYMKKIADYYQFKTRQDPDALYNTLFRNSGLYKPEDAIQIINNSNFSQEQIDTLMEMYNITGESYGN